MTTSLHALSILLSKVSALLVSVALAQATYNVTPLPVSKTPLPAVLQRVAACESSGDPNAPPRQFKADGSVLWGNDPKTGEPVERDCGEFQINTWAHADELQSLGLDVCHSQSDNDAYALILYERNGLKDWSASQQCWQQQL
jgi:hypothetical protein